MSRFISTVLAALLVASTAHAEFSRAGAPSNTPGHYNVMDYGADGQNGVIWSTNDTSAFQAAVDAAGAAGGGIVDIPPGVYYLQDSLVVNYDGVTLRGSGRTDHGTWEKGTVIALTPSFANIGQSGILFGHKADSSATFNCGLEDLTVRANTGRNGHVIWAKNVQSFRMFNVDVYAPRVAAPDNKHASVYIQAENNQAGTGILGAWKLQTTKNRIIDCNIWCPDGINETGSGYGLLIASTVDNGVNTANIIQNTTFSDSKSPGRSIMVTAKCGECGELTNSLCGGHQFVGVRVDASGYYNSNTGVLYPGGGVEFCESDRNLYIGHIDTNPALSDTAVFNQYESEDNMIIGRVDGYIYDEQPDTYRQLQVMDMSYRNGMQVRAMGFKDMAGARATLGGGEQEPPASLFYDSTVGRLILKTSAGEDTLKVRGE